MAKASEPGMTVYEFGRALLAANDLDPVYVLVHHAALDPITLKRWLLAYWAFYHVGTASWIANAQDGEAGYWVRFQTAARSKNWPRSSERRHYRGENAVKSAAFLQAQGVGPLFDGFPRPDVTAADVIEYVTEWVGFGPWIAFKVADMMERLGLIRVRFDASTAMYKGSPTEAAEMLWNMERGGTRPPGVSAGAWAAGRVLKTINPIPAPPTGDRPLGFQEAETILCKWASYLKGRYHVGEDVAAVRAGLVKFAGCGLADRLATAGKKGGLW